MLKRDYLENQLDELSRFLQRLLDKLRLGNDLGTDKTLSTELRNEYGTHTLEDILAIPDEQFLDVLLTKYGYTPTSMKIAADVLYEIREDAPFNLKTLMLYEYYVAHTTSLDMMALQRIAKLKKSI
ncbi:MAG: hypothetical protein J0I41_09105 [Filimonas sp.]|nr:hypothetical protein [Filimonas sp.]